MAGFWVVAFVLLAVYAVLYKRPFTAFVTAPFAAMTLLYIGIYSERGEYVLLAPVLFIVAMTAVAVSSFGTESREWYHVWAYRILTIIALLLVMIVAAVALEVLGAAAFLPILFLMAFAAFVGSLIHYGKTSRQMAAMTVFSTIGASMRQNLPLPMALDCAATGRHDLPATLLRRIKTWLIKGYPLSEALRRGYPRCPPWALAMLAAGERIGQLPVAAAAVEKDMRTRAAERTRLRPVPPVYPLIILTIAFLFAMFLMEFVIPQFKIVLEEMTEGKLPMATRILMEVMSFIIYKPGPWVQFGFVVAVMLVYVLYRVSRRRRPDKPYLHSWILDSVRWFLPIVRWFERNRSVAQAVELLRISLDAGCPVNEAIRNTLRLDVNVFFRRRLACWLRCVERGDDIGDSARRCKLGKPLAWAFGGPNAGNTPAILETLESYYRSNYSYRVNLARFILWPLCIIGLGLTVGFIVFALFSPCVAVLREMCANVYP
jgi:type II secretory pathway component PulF